MMGPTQSQLPVRLFVLVIVASALVATAYLWQAMSRASSPAPTPTLVTTTAPAPAAADAPEQQTRLFSIDYGAPAQRGYVKQVALATPNEAGVVSPLRCTRMHFAAGVGICLQNYLSEWVTPVVSVTLFNASFQPLHVQRVDGLASRARVSPDGKYAAFTVFVTGHSYNDTNFSTATHLWEVATGVDLGNLETFRVVRDGQVFQAVDFNFWGVTFAQDSNHFYATLHTGGVPLLVAGDLAARRMTVVYAGVECPSLSPDNRRIAFKKARGNWEWQLTVLDLATLRETPLAETRTVDDQAEWLDDATVLYEQTEYDSTRNAWISVHRVPADGSGAPAIFASKVGSPAVVR